MGTPQPKPPMNTDPKNSPQAKEASGLITPRLLDLAGVASYLSVSTWTVRDLEAAGILQRVRVPHANNGELRKILFDRNDLDRLIEVWKEPLPFA